LLAREWPVDEIAPYIALVEAVEDKQEGGIYRLSDTQVRAILDLRLHRLTALGRDEMRANSSSSPRRSPACSRSSATAASCTKCWCASSTKSPRNSPRRG
jgi:hypothetical protein